MKLYPYSGRSKKALELSAKILAPFAKTFDILAAANELATLVQSAEMHESDPAPAVNVLAPVDAKERKE